MNRQSTLSIKPLEEVPHLSSILAFWSYRQWYLTRKMDFSLNLKAYEKRAKSIQIPYTFVALMNDFPVGMASLKENDLWERKDINPWLASVYTDEKFRNIGIGQKLVEATCEHAFKLGFPQIFLFLDKSEISKLKSYYKKFGFEYFDKAIDNDGFDTEIMIKRF